MPRASTLPFLTPAAGLDAALGRLQALRPDLAAVLEFHAVLDDRPDVLLVTARSAWQNQEAVRTLIPAKAVLAEVFGKPVGLCWP